MAVIQNPWLELRPSQDSYILKSDRDRLRVYYASVRYAAMKVIEGLGFRALHLPKRELRRPKQIYDTLLCCALPRSFPQHVFVIAAIDDGVDFALRVSME